MHNHNQEGKLFCQNSRVAFVRGNCQCFDTLRIQVDQKLECMFTSCSEEWFCNHDIWSFDSYCMQVVSSNLKTKKYQIVRDTIDWFTTIYIANTKIQEVLMCFQIDLVSNQQSFTNKHWQLLQLLFLLFNSNFSKFAFLTQALWCFWCFHQLEKFKIKKVRVALRNVSWWKIFTAKLTHFRKIIPSATHMFVCLFWKLACLLKDMSERNLKEFAEECDKNSSLFGGLYH